MQRKRGEIHGERERETDGKQEKKKVIKIIKGLKYIS